MFPLTNVFRPIWAKFSFLVLLLVILNLIVISGSSASLKEECDYDWDCGENAVCGYKRCVCKMGYKENPYSDGCRLFLCKNDFQCNIFGWNTHCSFTCYCDNGYSTNPNTQQCERNPTPSPTPTPSSPSNAWSIIRIVIIVFGAIIGIALIGCCGRLCKRRRQASSSTTVILPRRMTQPVVQPMPVPVSNPYSQPQFQYPPPGQSMPQPQYQPMSVPYQPGRTDESNQWYSPPSQPNDAAPSAPPSYFESVADQTPSQNPDYSSRTQPKY